MENSVRAVISTNGLKVFDILEQLREDIHSLPQDIEGFAKKIFYSKEIQDFIVEANQRNLKQGLRPDGEYIEKTPEGKQKSTFYERLTIYKREKKDLQTQFVDLYQSGFFHDSLKVRSGSSELLEFSSDPKAVEIERVWGEILGISNDDLNELILLLRPKIIKFVNEKLKLRS